MATAIDRQPKEFTEFHLFAGIGGGSMGAADARMSWLGVNGSIRNVGAIDFDALACEDYRRLTGSPISCIDLFDREQYVAFHGCEPSAGWKEATPADILEAAGGICPDIVFTSPPCKGFSGLLPNRSAGSDKYQALNRLTVRSIRLSLEAFKSKPPKVFLLENVPRIKSRGAELLDEIKGLLRSHGYVCNDADHDCGEIGGLGQRRKRYLLIARHEASVKPFIYQPPQRPLKTIGDIIGPLPFPDDPSMGPMHRLPRLKWLTWLRLALIPAGGDWRDLQKIAPDEYRLVHEPRGGGPWGVQGWGDTGATVTGSSSVKGSNATAIADPRVHDKDNRHHSHYRVTEFDQPAGTVTGATHVANGAATFADARLGHAPRPGVYRVMGMDETSGAVTGGQGVGVSNGPQAIADPRLKLSGENYGGSPGLYGVMDFDQTAPVVTGSAKVSSSNTPAAVADHRLPESKGVYPNRFRIVKWDSPAPVVTGDTDVQCGAPSISDPRLDTEPRSGYMRVIGMDEASPAVVGAARTTASNGPSVIADHRLGCKPRGNTRGPMGVQKFDEPSSTVFGALDIHAGPAAVADIRIPGNKERLDPPPVIVSLDGTWHRPLTTLELLALQSFPLKFADGSPVVLAGKSDSKWRERIGNAVPPAASRRMHEQILLALLQNELGETFTLGHTDIWVDPGKTIGQNWSVPGYHG